MTHRRRALLLAGLALVLGGLAANDVGSREAALERRIGPLTGVVVAERPVRAGARLGPGRLALRRVPARYAPRGAVSQPGALHGLRAAVDIPAGTEVLAAMVATPGQAPGAPVRRGERVADVTAAGSPELVRAGGRVDVLITTEGRAGADGATRLALEDVEVLHASPAPTAANAEAQSSRRVSVSLRVTVRQAVYLAAAGSFAREIRLLPRPAGDRRRGHGGLTYGSSLLG